MSSTTTTATPTNVPLCCCAASTTAELLDCRVTPAELSLRAIPADEESLAALIVPDAPDAVDPERSLESLAIGTSLEDLPDSVSRFNRFRSPRMSEAC